MLSSVARVRCPSKKLKAFNLDMPAISGDALLPLRESQQENNDADAPRFLYVGACVGEIVSGEEIVKKKRMLGYCVENKSNVSGSPIPLHYHVLGDTTHPVLEKDLRSGISEWATPRHRQTWTNCCWVDGTLPRLQVLCAQKSMTRCVVVYLAGTLGLVVQFNPSHLKNKRPVDPLLLKPSTDETSAKPKASGFNFTLVKREEFLSGFRFGTGDDQHLSPVQTIDMEDVSKDEPEHFVLVNVAPLVRGHMLFVFELNLVKPQKMTKRFMLCALSISQAIPRKDFALGFNSAGAWSSVNHFHLQAYFFPHIEDRESANFPVATQLREAMFRVGGVVVKHLPDWKTTCYVIEPEDPASNETHVVEIAWTLVGLLQSQGIPHNLLVVGRVVCIFPRQPQCENGAGFFTDSASETDTTTASAGLLRIAVAELSGLVIAGDSVVYDNLTEEMFNTILEKQVSLVASEEAALTAAWKEKLHIKTKQCPLRLISA